MEPIIAVVTNPVFLALAGVAGLALMAKKRRHDGNGRRDPGGKQKNNEENRNKGKVQHEKPMTA